MSLSSEAFLLSVKNAYLKRFAIIFKINPPIANSTTMPDPVIANIIKIPIKNPFL